MVILSQPHLFRPGGVIECLGEQIVQELYLVTMPCGRKRTRSTVTAQGESNVMSATVTTAKRSTGSKRTRAEIDDVEPSDESDDGNDVDYYHRKRMSANIFKYVVQADSAREENMKLLVSAEVREMWQCVIVQYPQMKLDDIGDAILHALNEILCGASKCRQLVPSSVSLHNNRTVVVSVFRDHTYWAIIHCTWNTFELEDLGFQLTKLKSRYFNSNQTVTEIRETLMQ